MKSKTPTPTSRDGRLDDDRVVTHAMDIMRALQSIHAAQSEVADCRDQHHGETVVNGRRVSIADSVEIENLYTHLEAAREAANNLLTLALICEAELAG